MGGGGILPIAIHNNEIYLFFGREALIPKGKSSGLWSDFGGKKENNETVFETALREGWEETSGILGNMKHLKQIMKNNTIGKIYTKTYTTFLIEINYDTKLPKLLKDRYTNALKNHKDKVIEENGLYEKDRGKWLSLNQLKNIDKHKKIKFRKWYVPIIKKIIDFFENYYKHSF